MTSKLTLFNGALRVLGEEQTTLSEEGKARRELDRAWDEGVVNYCLRQGQWTFATRTQKLNASTSIIPDFGLTFAFEKPTDWMATIAVCNDPYFKSPIIGYAPETSFIYSDFNEIYVKFTSNDSTYGGDFSLWSESFAEYVHHYLARKTQKIITQGEQVTEKDLEKSRLIALNNDRQNKSAQYLPLGSFASARLRGGGNRYYSETGNFPVS